MTVTFLSKGHIWDRELKVFLLLVLVFNFFIIGTYVIQCIEYESRRNILKGQLAEMNNVSLISSSI